MRFLTKVKAKTQLPKLHFKSPVDMLKHGFFQGKHSIEPVTQEHKKEAYLLYYHEAMARTLELNADEHEPSFNKPHVTEALIKKFGGTWQEAYKKAAVWHDRRVLDLVNHNSFFDPEDWEEVYNLVDAGEWGETGSDYTLGDAANPGGEPKHPPEID